MMKNAFKLYFIWTIMLVLTRCEDHGGNNNRHDRISSFIPTKPDFGNTAEDEAKEITTDANFEDNIKAEEKREEITASKEKILKEKRVFIFKTNKKLTGLEVFKLLREQNITALSSTGSSQNNPQSSISQSGEEEKEEKVTEIATTTQINEEVTAFSNNEESTIANEEMTTNDEEMTTNNEEMTTNDEEMTTNDEETRDASKEEYTSTTSALFEESTEDEEVRFETDANSEKYISTTGEEFSLIDETGTTEESNREFEEIAGTTTEEISTSVATYAVYETTPTKTQNRNTPPVSSSTFRPFRNLFKINDRKVILFKLAPNGTFIATGTRKFKRNATQLEDTGPANCSSRGPRCARPGYFRVKRSCTRFYRCEFDRKCAKFLPSKIQTCPKCLKFNAAKMRCDLPENVPECTYSYSFPKNVCTGVGKFFVPNDCHKYYDCRKGTNGTVKLDVKTCQSPMVFDQKKKKCQEGKCSLPVYKCKQGELYLGDKFDCNKFYYCVNSDVAIPIYCPAEFVFNGNICENGAFSDLTNWEKLKKSFQ